MRDLTPHIEQFDEVFPNYADAEYDRIVDRVAAWRQPYIQEFLASPEFEQSAELVAPFIAIKNYKTRVPFPEDTATTVRLMVAACQLDIEGDPVDVQAYENTVLPVLNVHGVGLPTASALLQFCHPDKFPIVDTNIKTACDTLFAQYPEDFAQFQEPPTLPQYRIPAPQQLTAYQQFVCFVFHVKKLQTDYVPNTTYREVDKGLMVLAKSALPLD